MKTFKSVLTAVLVLAVCAANAQTKKEAKSKEVLPEKTIQETVKTEGDDLTDVKVPAQYPGGNEAMFAYISENVKYPEFEKKKNIQGKVFAKFIVKSTGEIGDVEILRTVEGSKNLNAEVTRVIKAMPKWIPGTKDGVAVDTEMTLPFKFAL